MIRYEYSVVSEAEIVDSAQSAPVVLDTPSLLAKTDWLEMYETAVTSG